MIDHEILAQFWSQTFSTYIPEIAGAVIGLLITITIITLFDYLFLRQEEP